MSELERKLLQLQHEMQLLLDEEAKIRQQTEAVLQKAKQTIDPRQEFNNWLKSKAGQLWKSKQYEFQQHRCAYCKDKLRFQDAVVHHVLPLNELGRVANRTKNFKLLHPSCNLKIGTRIVKFD